jgi:MFS family permease
MIFSLTAMGLTNMIFVFALNAALAGLMTGLTAFFTLVFVRLWFGLLSPGLQPAAMAAMTDATTPMTRAGGLGMLGACISIGSILGPAGATVLAPFGALMPIWGTIALNLVVAIILAVVLPPTRPRPKSAKRPTPLAVRDPRVFPHLVFLFSYFIAIGIVQQTLSWFIEDRYQFVDTATRSAGEAVVLHTGIAFACFAAGMIGVQFGYVQPRKPDPRKILPVGLAIVALGYVGADLFFPFWAMAVSFLAVGAGAALAVPAANALGSLSVKREEQGSASALLAAAPPAGFIFGPLIGATLYSFMPQLPLYVSAGLIGSLAVYALLVTSKRPLTPS